MPIKQAKTISIFYLIKNHFHFIQVICGLCEYCGIVLNFLICANISNEFQLKMNLIFISDILATKLAATTKCN